MTNTKYARPALTARPDLLALMDTRPLWNLEQLRTLLNLDAPVVQHVLADLLAQGEIRSRFVAPDPTITPEPHYSLNRARPAGLPVRPRSVIEEQLLTFLLGRKETLKGICTALDHPKLKIIHALAWLDEQELITCTFVGHLPIFSLPLPTASSVRTA
ncbi:hypothetical protein [Deinococcus aquatilis]|uniref:hypothetical protein n=1 Tax=Deinococcus aquatilis TaxID=519440 RepID=UPI0003607C6C|nr:hypothetical protein [Deinococcus aquatilis]